jgi:hypothetical protein
MIYEIIKELNESNSTNYKTSVLRKHKDNKLLQKVLKMTYDTVVYNYGVSTKQIAKFEKNKDLEINFEESLELITENLCSRILTGHDALQFASNTINNLNKEDADVLKKIINRDIRINIGKTQINKVWKGLITKPCYMRCGVYGDKTAKQINYPSIIQLKSDGTYREFTVENSIVTSRSRSGEIYLNPIIFEIISNFPDGVYVGELTVKGISDRAKGNGLINSDNPPINDIILELWDYITIQEYALAAKKDRKNPCVNTYETRWGNLKNILSTTECKNIKLIDSNIVNNIQEALQKTSEYMNAGFEGAVLKDLGGVYKDGTSNKTLKLKIFFSIDVRVTGFTEGKIGTKREDTFGSINYTTDDGLISGSVSGFMDKELKEINSARSLYIGKIIEIGCNDLSKAKGNNFYALSHPRFIEFRNDKDTTNTLSELLDLKEMAMCLS